MGAPDEFHPDAHPDAREITGERRYGEWGQCIATAKSTGERCRGYAQGPHGKCNTHGGATPTAEENPDVGAEENNTNAETHGGYADAEKWFERHREECGDEVRRTVAAWVEKANFEWTNHGNIKLLVEAAINEQQIGNLNDYIRANGEIVETVVDTDEAGRPITTEEENPAFLAKSRLTKDTVRILNKFGILESPEKQQADAAQTIAERLSAANEQANNA